MAFNKEGSIIIESFETLGNARALARFGQTQGRFMDMRVKF